jgi:uncharacterized membrane protein
MLLLHRLSRRRGRRVHRVALVGLVALVATACVEDLGSLGGPSTVAVDVNDSGVTVGYGLAADGVTQRAFRRQPGGPIVDIGGPFDQSVANAVNEAGVAVGFTTTGGVSDAVVWNAKGKMRSLGLGPDSQATDIADDGTIVGQRGRSSDRRGFVLDAATGQIEALPYAHPGVPQYVTAVNGHGDVVGYEYTAGYTPVLWQGPDHTPVVLPYDGGFVTPTDINDAGDIVGTDAHDGRNLWSDAVWWRAGTHERVDLPAPPGGPLTSAHAINAAGDVVGSAGTDRYDPGPERAVRWSIHAVGPPTDLGDLGGGSSGARAVDSTGAAVGWAATKEVGPDGQPIIHAARFPAPPEE